MCDVVMGRLYGMTRKEKRQKDGRAVDALRPSSLRYPC